MGGRIGAGGVAGWGAGLATVPMRIAAGSVRLARSARPGRAQEPAAAGQAGGWS